MIRNKAILIFPFIILSLLSAIWSGWLRIGWNFPITNIAAQHGALMVNSFLASLIFLERAVVFRNKWVIECGCICCRFSGYCSIAFYIMQRWVHCNMFLLYVPLQRVPLFYLPGWCRLLINREHHFVQNQFLPFRSYMVDRIFIIYHCRGAFGVKPFFKADRL